MAKVEDSVLMKEINAITLQYIIFTFTGELDLISGIFQSNSMLNVIQNSYNAVVILIMANMCEGIIEIKIQQPCY